MTGPTTRQSLPSAIGFAARQAIVVLRRRHIPLAPLLARVHLSESDFAGQTKISAAAQASLLELAAEALGDGALGLHLAMEANLREVGLLYYAATAASDVGEMLGLYARYGRIVNAAMRLKLTRTEDGNGVEFDFHGLPRHAIRQNVEFMAAIGLKAIREASNRNIRPTRVFFAHARSTGVGELERFFGCSVEFGASLDQFFLTAESWSQPLITGDVFLLNTLRPFCDEAAKERGTEAGTLRASVENEAQKLLPHGKAHRQAVAKALGMSERTLSRKLADENTTFEVVIDELRQSLALQYIKEPTSSVSQIAWLLGYEGSASFSHAFSRWTGHSPSSVRNARRFPAGDGRAETAA